ncbi:MAG TPA: hypothetical protein VK988_15710 [Acidimicrobiales bacterium]|nr:hypothetical protein [Acidimicrobiales bacterium]
MGQLIQLIGAALILTAFVLAQIERLEPSSAAYLTLNLLGGMVLALVAAVDLDLGFLVLESVWAAVSAAGLVRLVQARRQAAKATHQGKEE